MTYRLKFNESLGKGWRRIVRQQIEMAIERLGSGQDIDGAIHETRKSLKRVRALLKLLRPALSASDYRRQSVRYRDIGRILSGVRDHAVLLATVETLAKETTGLAHKEADAFLAIISEQPVAAAFETNITALHEVERVKSERVRDALVALRRAAGSLDKLRVKESSFDMVRRGIERSYRDARNDMKRSLEADVDEEFHVWRKSVQAHWRHMLLIERAWPELFAARAQLAKEISDLLGFDHDLSIMMERAAQISDQRVKNDSNDTLVNAARERQREIRKELQIKGAILFAEPTARFAASVEAYWRAAKEARKLEKKKKRIAGHRAPETVISESIEPRGATSGSDRSSGALEKDSRGATDQRANDVDTGGAKSGNAVAGKKVTSDKVSPPAAKRREGGSVSGSN